MIDASDLGYPNFDEAEARFRVFARGQGFNLQIIHARRDDLIFANGRWFARRVEPNRSRSWARRAYEAATTRGFGVSLTGRCILNGAIGVYVYGPIDADEAERLMYPNGLKLSIVVTLPKAEVVGPLRWTLLRARQLLRPGSIAHSADLLK
jgi:hypothetical protein